MPSFRAGFAHPLDELRDEFDRLWTTLTAAPPLHGWGAGHRGDVFPAVTMWDSVSVGVFGTFPFPDALARMREGSS